MISPTMAPAALPVASYALALGDDALILSHRLGEWITNAPQLEEDVALANIGLDLLGQARALLTYAGEAEAVGRDEDALAYRRYERDFRNLQIVERPNGDFAVTMARQLAFAAYQYELYSRLQTSADSTLAGIAAKAVKEVAYHRDHATQWVLRLGDGTDQSRRRMQAGLEEIWPYVDEMFAPDVAIDGAIDAANDAANDAAAVRAVDLAPSLVADGVAVAPSSLREPWEAYIHPVLAEATLTVPEPTFRAHGGRNGIHTEVMGYLLAEMQHLHRAYPGASW